MVEHPAPGEVVWRDGEGVTCRRWNWRQCRRTRLTTGTTTAVFLLDALAPMDDGALLAEWLAATGPDVRLRSRLIAPAVVPG